MSFLSAIKSTLINPFFVTLPIEILGTVDSWGVLKGSLSSTSKILSAGVGQNISFEEQIVNRYDAKIILLDPSPTGITTIKRREVQHVYNIDFRELGLAGGSGLQSFGKPDRANEGSFRKAHSEDSLQFDCTTVRDIMTNEGIESLDLLKMDIEGFEYEVIDSILANKVKVDQICLEIHTRNSICIDQSVFDAYFLILKLCRYGYRIVYNKAMDFTFVSEQLRKRYR